MHLRQGLVLIALVILVFPVVAAAQSIAPDSHGWASYHWGRPCSGATGCEAAITIYNTTATTNTNWGDHLQKSIFGDPSNPNATDRRGWNDSTVLALSITSSSASRSSCSPVSGAIRVCNYTYGNNGWLGLASINTTSGTTHIAWGTAKMNDTYFNGGSYPNTEKRHVMCQEVGHTFGLGHTSENGSSQNTCMDYYQNTSASDWTSTGPNQHDFDQLLVQHHASLLAPAIMAATAFGKTMPVDVDNLNAPWQWGTPFEFDHEGRAVGFELDLEDAGTIWTFVRWADDDARGPRHSFSR